MKIRNVPFGVFAICLLVLSANLSQAQQAHAAQHAVAGQRSFNPGSGHVNNWAPRQSFTQNTQGRALPNYGRQNGFALSGQYAGRAQNFARSPQFESGYARTPNPGANFRAYGAEGGYGVRGSSLRSTYPIFNQADRVRAGFMLARVPEHRGFYDVVPFQSYRGGYLDELYGGIYLGRGRYNWGLQVILPYGGVIGAGFYQPIGPWRYCNGYRWWNARTMAWMSVPVYAGYGYDGVLVDPDLFMYSQWYEDLESGTWYDAEGYSQAYAPDLPPQTRYGVLIPEDIQTGVYDGGAPIVRHVKVMQTEIVPEGYVWGGPLTAYDAFSQVYINIPFRRR